MNDLTEISPAEGEAIEVTFLAALALIEAAEDLAASTKSQWMCSLRRIATALDRPLHLLPARWTAVRQPIERLHHVPLGVLPKTLANHVGNVRAALDWLRDGNRVPPRGPELAPEWQALRERLPDFRRRAVLSGLMRFCSAQGIAPESVDEEVVGCYFDLRTQTSSLSVKPAARRAIARVWNEFFGPLGVPPLVEPPIAPRTRMADWSEFPEGLRRDIEAYCEGLRKIHKNKKGRRSRPCSESTIGVRRTKLIAAVRKATSCGIALESLARLSDLLAPKVSERVLDAYWRESGDRPCVYTIELAQLFVAIAGALSGFDPEHLEQMRDMQARLDEFRRADLTDKNLALVRKLHDAEAWARLLSVPSRLMSRAEACEERAQTKAAVRAQLAVAIQILCFAPIRIGNLATIRVGENLIRPGGQGSAYRLVFQDYDVKNRVRLDFPLTEATTRLIDLYLKKHHSVLLRGRQEDWLFPGERAGHKTETTLSGQITDAISNEIGLEMTPHQFRHAAAALILQKDPGNYELVRLLLAHKNVATTMRAYIGLETAHAAEAFGKIMESQLAEKI